MLFWKAFAVILFYALNSFFISLKPLVIDMGFIHAYISIASMNCRLA